MEITGGDVGPAVCFAILFIVGVTGNGFILHYFIFKDKSTKTNYRIFIIYLATTDLLSSIYNPLFVIIPFQITRKHWFLGEYLCINGSRFGQGISTASSTILCGMMLLRHRSLAKPFAQPVKKWYINGYCILSTIFSMSVTYYTQLEKSYDGVACSYQVGDEGNGVLSLIIVFSYIIVVLMLPLLIIVILSYKTNALVKRQQQLNLGRVAISNSIHEKRTGKVIVLTVKTYLVLTIPASVFLLMLGFMFWKIPHIVAAHLQIFQSVAHYLLFILMSNSVVNCFLYAGRFPQFRKYIKRVFFMCCCCCRNRRRETMIQM